MNKPALSPDLPRSMESANPERQGTCPYDKRRVEAYADCSAYLETHHKPDMHSLGSSRINADHSHRLVEI